LVTPRANCAAAPGRRVTTDPSGLAGPDTNRGSPWASSSRTSGLPLTVQVLAETLRSWTVNQMVPAAPSAYWPDPRSAEAAQRRMTGRSTGGPVVDGGTFGAPLVWGVAVGAMAGAGVAVGSAVCPRAQADSSRAA